MAGQISLPACLCTNWDKRHVSSNKGFACYEAPPFAVDQHAGLHVSVVQLLDHALHDVLRQLWPSTRYGQALHALCGIQAVGIGTHGSATPVMQCR